MVHDEAEGITACTTAKTVIKLFIRADTERRCFFFMEGAAGGVVFACFLHLHARADDIDDIGAVQKVVNKALGD